jgi:hypothetical protein
VRKPLVTVIAAFFNETSAELHGGQDRLDKTRQWNAWLLQAEGSTHAAYRALDVVDWAAASAGHTEWLSSDGVHHTPIGEMAYAGFLYGARAA